MCVHSASSEECTAAAYLGNAFVQPDKTGSCGHALPANCMVQSPHGYAVVRVRCSASTQRLQPPHAPSLGAEHIPGDQEQ